ncbi:MAG: oligopeptide transporter, OPT family [Pirellulales bacterium]|nr:oligopeptide transporter, OPT family [Pirellulales bacterium]
MAVETTDEELSGEATAVDQFHPYVPDGTHLPEFTWPAVLLGTLLGILFGASSLYLVLKVGMTVSASIPVAVLSITLFRLFSRMLGLRRATILENNIVQTTGSAGESIAFGVGVTMPALLLLGFDMEPSRVMTVGTLGGLLGILMMIPLRRAFIVKQHKQLRYPEGTACAEVLIVGEQGGATAATVFLGFGVAFLYKLVGQAMAFWNDVVSTPLSWVRSSSSTSSAAGATQPEGLRAVLGGELSPELLGVGYIIGPRIASIMLAGGVLAYLVFAPLIVMVKGDVPVDVPANASLLQRELAVAHAVRSQYILYIGAGAVATGGVLSMFQVLPLIVTSIFGGLRDLRRPANSANGRGLSAVDEIARVPRTNRDLPMGFVLLGTVGLVIALSLFKNLGLGLRLEGLAGSVMIVLFGFLFVTVSSRLTGEIGSSSNPISGMTVATLLLTCFVFLMLGKTGKEATLTALTVAAVVCIAASNGGTTAQDLKTGYLVGATPRLQQWGILIGAITSALVMGVTLPLLNQVGTIYSKKPENLPTYQVPAGELATLTQRERPGGQYSGVDDKLYRVLHVHEGERAGLPRGRYLVADDGRIAYVVDPAVNGRIAQRDDGARVMKFEAPKTQLMALIIDGILNQRLPWKLVLIGALIAVALELTGTAALPFAVGIYLPITTSMPIFIGGAIRWFIDRRHRGKAKEGEGDTSPGVLLSSGYIAGGSIAGMLLAFFAVAPERFRSALEFGKQLPESWLANRGPDWLALAAFAGLIGLLIVVGYGRILRGNAAQAADRP